MSMYYNIPMETMMLQLDYLMNRSNHPEVFCKNVVFRNFAKFAGKHLCQRLFFNKVAGLSLLGGCF